MKLTKSLIIRTRRANVWIEKHSALAAWVQAFGAIVALVLTLWLAYQTSNQSELQAVQAVNSWSHQLELTVKDHIVLCQKQDGGEQANRSPSIKMQDLLFLAQSIAADRLPEKKIDPYLELRMLSIDAMSARQDLQIALQRHEKPVEWAEFESRFREIEEKIKIAKEKFGK